MRGRSVIPSTLRVEHGDPTTDALLWLPDQVLGATGAAFAGETRYADHLATTVETIWVRA